MSSATLYVDVVILKHLPRAHTSRHYTYALLPEQSDAHQRGRIVSVPFGKAVVNAVVFRAHQQPPTRPAKTVLSVSAFWLTPAQITLCEWICRHHNTSIVTALELFLPRSIIADIQEEWQATAAGLQTNYADLPEDERGILYLLRSHGGQSITDIQQRSKQPLPTVRNILVALSARGLVEHHIPLDTPSSTPIQWVTLANPPSDADTQWFVRATKQHDIYRSIQQSPQQRCPVQHVGGRAALQKLAERGLIRFMEAPAEESVPPAITAGVTLNPAQQHAFADLIPAVHAQQHDTALLHGITGSGKTEIYFALIDECLAQHKQVLVLVPEIALTTQLAQRFQQRFPGRVQTIHGQITPKQRRERWLDCMQGRTSIILGPRSALSIPLPQLGLIIVDEEHDASFKYEQAPYLHARNAAMVYAKIARVPIVLGSATPSVELMYAARQQKIRYVKLEERVNHEAQTIMRPPISIVDLRTEACIDRYNLISQPLAERLHEALAHDQSGLLLLNRRGNSGARICRHCGERAECSRCSTPLVIHTRGQRIIGMCHSCGLQKLLEPHCPHCFHTDFLDVGSGTQRVCQVVAEFFPTATVVQWDRDTASTARAHAQLLAHAQAQPRTVIVGTQMVAKGLDIADIAVVGVLNTDTALAMPDFRSAEQTYQLLTQVAGRAGRRGSAADVFLQSFQPEHYAIQAAAHYQDTAFYDQELAFRAHLRYPPYNRMIKLVWTHHDEQRCMQRAQQDAQAIRESLASFTDDVRLIGPAPAFFQKVRDHYRWQLFLVGSKSEHILPHIAHVHHAIVDVDPVSLL